MIYIKFYYDAEINYFKIKQINKFFCLQNNLCIAMKLYLNYLEHLIYIKKSFLIS